MTRRIVLALLVALALVGGLAAPADARPHRNAVLGSKTYYAPYGQGWGTRRPATVFNGGVPSGLISNITWKGWGNKKARGYGLGNQYRPEGGYYAKKVKVQLIARSMSRCTRNGPRAYTKLYARFQARPGGPFEKWFSWSGPGRIC